MTHDRTPHSADAETLKALLLQASTFRQFRDHPDFLKVEVPEIGCLRLRLTNFPGLDTNRLLPRDLFSVSVPGYRLTYGSIMSGSPEGIVAQYSYARTDS